MNEVNVAERDALLTCYTDRVIILETTERQVRRNAASWPMEGHARQHLHLFLCTIIYSHNLDKKQKYIADKQKTGASGPSTNKEILIILIIFININNVVLSLTKIKY